MPRTKKDAPAGIDKLTSIHRDLLAQTDRLNDVLINLQYEGKTKLGKNLKEIWDVLCFFEKEVDVHVGTEEACLFPFISTHVPRLDPLVQLFHAEHEDFRKNLRIFRLAMEDLCSDRSEENKILFVDRVREIGTYLVYLLRQHLKAENESLYKAINEELHEEERLELDKLIQQHEEKKKLG